jgi:uncharacterized membrane protein YphA (DoxX/SURF4 family)
MCETLIEKEIRRASEPTVGPHAITAHDPYGRSNNMSASTPNAGFYERPDSVSPRTHASPSYQAYQILHVAFTVAPLIAGIDKFFHLLVNWDLYLAPVVNRILGGHGHLFTLVAGVIEIIAGIGVAIWPRFFAYVVSAWLLGIVINLLLVPGFYDIALRDFGLCLGALALGRLSHEFARTRAVGH